MCVFLDVPLPHALIKRKVFRKIILAAEKLQDASGRRLEGKFSEQRSLLFFFVYL
jgi:hypothetical protein